MSCLISEAFSVLRSSSVQCVEHDLKQNCVKQWFELDDNQSYDYAAGNNIRKALSVSYSVLLPPVTDGGSLHSLYIRCAVQTTL